jgi:cytochrome d ubiquinol oxidase subunit I
MIDFWSILLSPVAMNKFFHTIISAWVLGAVFVIGVSSWYLLKKRNLDFAKKSILTASVFGIVASVLLLTTGHGSAYHAAQRQPMKLAVMEGLYEGHENADLLAFAFVNPKKEHYNDGVSPLLMPVKVPVPGFLSWLAYKDSKAFVPGIKDIIDGGYQLTNGATALSFEEKKARGLEAMTALENYQQAKKADDTQAAEQYKAELYENYAYFGYGYIDKPEDLIPNVPLVFYSFHVMVGLGVFFIVLFLVVIFFTYRKTFEKKRWLQWICLLSIPLAYIAGQAGWIVAEVGRQPWAIQDVLPVQAAISDIPANSVKLTFFVFLALFTILLIAEIKIMLKQIKKGPEE